jgi:hypothetical protein
VLAAVRWAVKRVIAARRGGHPAPPVDRCWHLPYLIAAAMILPRNTGFCKLVYKTPSGTEQRLKSDG